MVRGWRGRAPANGLVLLLPFTGGTGQGGRVAQPRLDLEHAMHGPAVTPANWGACLD